MADPQIMIPPDLQLVLRDFTKSVLRDKPDDLLVFCRDYFCQKAEEARCNSYKLPPSESQAFKQLSKRTQQDIENVFKRYDLDSDMSITLDELKVLIADMGDMFQLGVQSVDEGAATMMGILDTDGSAEVSWQEWSHACAVWLLEVQGDQFES